MLLGLGQMLSEHGHQSVVLRAVGSGPELADGVLLGAVDIGEVLDDLLLDALAGHMVSNRGREFAAARRGDS